MMDTPLKNPKIESEGHMIADLPSLKCRA